MRRAHRPQNGFTLIEMVMVIVITGIIAAMIGVFIRSPIEGYMDLTRRAELVDSAESALRLMARDIRRALPNSIRISGNALEMINTLDAVRYRTDPPGNAAQRLEFNKADTDFNAIGRFTNITTPYSTSSARLVVYNLGVPGADAYNGNVITPAGTTITIAADTAPGEDHINLDIGHQFAYESPRQRLFLVDGPISYYCDLATGRLLRDSGYAIQAVQPTTPAGTPVTTHVSGCSITYQPGTSNRAALVTLALTLSDSGESINLLHQVHVDNVP